MVTLGRLEPAAHAGLGEEDRRGDVGDLQPVAAGRVGEQALGLLGLLVGQVHGGVEGRATAGVVEDPGAAVIGQRPL